VTCKDANADWRLAYQAFKRALAAAPWPQSYHSYTAEGKRLDNLSVPEWLDDPTYPARPAVGPNRAEKGSRHVA
jgi:hypothetical protein